MSPRLRLHLGMGWRLEQMCLAYQRHHGGHAELHAVIACSQPQKPVVCFPPKKCQFAAFMCRHLPPSTLWCMSCFKINCASASKLLCKDLKGTEVHLKLLANPASTGLNDQESHEKISVLDWQDIQWILPTCCIRKLHHSTSLCLGWPLGFRFFSCEATCTMHLVQNALGVSWPELLIHFQGFPWIPWTVQIEKPFSKSQHEMKLVADMKLVTSCGGKLCQTLQKMNTCQPEVDRGKLIKWCLDDCSLGFCRLLTWLWTEESNLTNVCCSQSIRSGNLLHLKLQKMSTYQPELDRGKLIKLCLDV